MATSGIKDEGQAREAVFLEVMKAVLRELPRTHKGFRCQYTQDQIKSAFETVSDRFRDYRDPGQAAAVHSQESADFP